MVNVRSYSRRKYERVKPVNNVAPGKELEVISGMTSAQIAAEKKRRAAWEENYRIAEAERKKLGLTPEQYSLYKLRSSKKKPKPIIVKTMQPRKSKHTSFLDRLNIKLDKFLNRHKRK